MLNISQFILVIFHIAQYIIHKAPDPVGTGLQERPGQRPLDLEDFRMREQLTALGCRIRDLRKQRNMTLQELGEKTHLTAGLLSKIENFRTVPSLPVLAEIARALGFRASFLPAVLRRYPSIKTEAVRHSLTVCQGPSCGRRR